MLAAIDAAAQPAEPAPTGSPQWVVERFFGRDGFPERARHYTGEMLDYVDDQTLGAVLPPDASWQVRPLHVDSASAVYTVAIRADGEVYDWYAYVAREPDAWKLAAVRTLALPALFHEALDSLAARPNLEPEWEAAYRRMRLTVAPDSALKAHFAQNRDALEQIARLATANADLGSISTGPGVDEPRSNAERSIRTLLDSTSVSGLTRPEEHPGCIFLVIGGMIDNEIGYLYAPPGCRVPEMTPNRFIYIEELAPGWYLYKTT